MPRSTRRNLTISPHKKVDLVIVTRTRYHKGGRSCVKYGIPCRFCLVIIVVVLLERPNQARLRANALGHFEMIQPEGLRVVCFQPLVQLIILHKVERQLFPVEVGRRNGLIFSDLGPISACFQRITHQVGIVAATQCKRVPARTRVHQE